MDCGTETDLRKKEAGGSHAGLPEGAGNIQQQVWLIDVLNITSILSTTAQL